MVSNFRSFLDEYCIQISSARGSDPGHLQEARNGGKATHLGCSCTHHGCFGALCTNVVGCLQGELTQDFNFCRRNRCENGRRVLRSTGQVSL
jgi:hypothetical protein